MLQNLKRIFPDMIETTPGQELDTDHYLWFTTSDHKLVGIPTNITEKEQLLLETFLTPFHASQPPATNHEENWMNVLYHGKDPNALEKTVDTYRFVYFSLSDDSVDPIEFREAIHGLHPIKVPILWENSHEGVIIEENTSKQDDSISYNEIIDVLMSDFYMKVRLYISSYFHDLTQAAKHYHWVKKCFAIIQPYSKGPVANYIDAVPYLVLDQLDKQTTEHIIDSILQDTVEEEELLNTIQTFLECNSNATLAAKKLYMHRNSLQYRVDKFIEKTGIDVKQFHGALTVYLALSIRQRKK